MEGMSETLNSAEMLAQAIRDGRTESVDELNDQIALLGKNSAEVQTTISQTSDDVAEIKRKALRWIDLGSLSVILIYLWFGAAQYLLMRSGWYWLR